MAGYAKGPGNVDNDLLALTLEDYRPQLTEQWLSGIPFTKKIMESQNVDQITGGVSINEMVEFQDNDTAGFVASTDTLSTAINQIATQAHFEWGLLAGTVGILDTEGADNMGKNQLKNLLKTRVANLTNTFKEQMEVAFGQSSTPNINTFWSLIDIVDSGNPTLGNFGDIERAANTWWQATETGSGSMATQGLEDIRTAYHTVSRGGIDPVNMHLTTQTLYTAYQARLTPSERLQQGQKGDLEFDHLTFMRKPVFFSEQLLSGVWLGLNTKYLRFRINPAMHFKSQGFVRAPGGMSKSSVVQIRANLTCNRPASNFKLTGMTA